MIEHVRYAKGVSINDYILKQRTAGYFIALLQDTCGGYHHCVGINKNRGEIYDPMESHVLPLSAESLNIACGENCEFKQFKLVDELNQYIENFDDAAVKRRRKKKETKQKT